MPVIVSDASIIMDLDRGALTQDLFRLAHEFAVPDLLFAREFAGAIGAQLLELGLRIEELSPYELRRAADLRRRNKNLSAPDSFAFAIAEIRG